MNIIITPLHWLRDDRGWWTADAYRIEPCEEGGFAARVTGPSSRAFSTICERVSFEAAKEVAQEHHDRRVLSFLKLTDAEIEAIAASNAALRKVRPEPCLKDRCRSPVACEGWGYCRERNLMTDEVDEAGHRPQSLIDERRAQAATRKAK